METDQGESQRNSCPDGSGSLDGVGAHRVRVGWGLSRTRLYARPDRPVSPTGWPGWPRPTLGVMVFIVMVFIAPVHSSGSPLAQIQRVVSTSAHSRTVGAL